VYTIYKQVTFAAAHHLTKVPSDHQCARVHGHNYVVEFEVRALDLDESDFVLDYGVLKSLVAPYDHRDLNDFFVNPTAEVIAQHLYEGIAQIPNVRPIYVRVHENDSSWAEYRG